MISRYFRTRRRRKYLAERVSIRRAGDDLFSESQRAEFDRILADLKTEKDPVQAVKTAEKRMEKISLPWNTSSLRNLLDLFLVVGAVAFGIRGLYFQPFRIPTSSMQPTLYGIHYPEPDAEANRIQKKLPGLLRPLFFANTRARAVVTAPGMLDPNSLRHESGAVFDRTAFLIGGKSYSLPGDPVKIVDNQLYVRPAGESRFVRAQDLSPRFSRIYSGKGGYQGHASGMGMEDIASGKEYTVPAGRYFMLGDNSRFSKDSRFFGTVPRHNLVGRAFLTFWPFSRRWGLVDRQAPLDVPTGAPGLATFPVVYKQ